MYICFLSSFCSSLIAFNKQIKKTAECFFFNDTTKKKEFPRRRFRILTEMPTDDLPSACIDSASPEERGALHQANMGSTGGCMKTPVYMDFNATTPVDEDVLKEMMPYFSDDFGNPSSIHSCGEKAREALKTSRGFVANVLEGNVDSVFFTSGATESLNWALRCGAIGRRKKLCEETEKENDLQRNLTPDMTKKETEKYRIVSCYMEHVAVINILSYLQKEEDFEVEYAPVEPSGHVSLEKFKQLLTLKTVLVSIPFADGEVGAIQPIKKLVEVVRECAPNALFHSDASQALGKTRVSVRQTDVDLLTFAGHKIYAPKGIGCLYIKEGVNIPPLIIGGNQQNGLRGGTENVASCVGLGKACEIIYTNMQQHIKHFEEKTKHIKQEFMQTLMKLTAKSELSLKEYVAFNGCEEHEMYLPNTLSICIKNAQGHEVVESLRDVMCISCGASCHDTRSGASPVLQAMQVSPSYSLGTVRISAGRYTTKEEASFVGKKLAEKLVELKYIHS